MKITSELLEKYFDGKCTLEEKKAIKKWINSSEEKVEYLTNDSIDHIEKDVWNSISLEINKEVKNRPINLLDRRKKPVSRTLKKWLIASCIAVLIGLFSVQFLFNNNTITHKTFVAQQKTITLHDGTKVYLNASSSLEVRKEFSENTRNVTLTGEAYFEVVKDSLRPFIINTNNSKTTVLGTKFNLSAYPNEHTVLTLNEGKVSFRTKDSEAKELILTPNEQGSIINNKLKKEIVNAKYYNTWKTNDLFFNDDLALVFKDIERKYDVTIKVKETNLLHKKYRGYHKQPNLKDLLKEISFVMKFKVKINGDTIIIY